jgi:hypothetical protein
MKIFQHVTLSADPTDAMDAVTKQYVDRVVNTGVITGGVFFTNISPTGSGIVGQKTYVANTIPANKVITEGTSDTNNVRVTVFAEAGGSFYSPVITITTDPPQAGGPITATLVEDVNDKRAYSGYADLTNITADTTVTATSNTNGVSTVIIHRAAAGPVMNALTIGALPGSQTEVKAGDTLPVTGKISNDATYAELVAGGAVNSLTVLAVGAVDSGGTGFRTLTGSFTVSGLSGLQSVSARGKNSLGTFGAALASSNQVTLNQTYPAIGAFTVTYPATQSGLKGSETATVSSTVTSADSVAYSTSSDITVASPAVYSGTKTVTRVGGTYSYGVNNYTITATKTSNNAVSTSSTAVTIANTAPSAAITITGAPARLQSSAAGQDYTITVSANQRLNTAPVITPSSGTFQGSWVGGPQVWTRTLRIVDSDPKGTQTFTAALTNGANVVGSTLTSGASYVVGGFPTRTITFAAFERYHAIGTLVTDITKTVAKYSGTASNLTLQNSTVDVFQGYTIVDSAGNYNPTGGYLFISDSAFAGSNTTGSLQLDITEGA